MKQITLAFVMFIAFVLFALSSASPPALAATACEYNLGVIVGACEDPGTDECSMCEPAVVMIGLVTDDPNCPRSDSSSVADLFKCCRECGGTFVPMRGFLP
jgi:hypothetical protein